MSFNKGSIGREKEGREREKYFSRMNRENGASLTNSNDFFSISIKYRIENQSENELLHDATKQKLEFVDRINESEI